MKGIKPHKRLLFALNRVLALAGLKLKRSKAATRYWPECFDNLKRLGFSPGVVVDVGVLDGTWELYDSFRSARFVLFEAMPHYEPALQDIARTLNASYHLVAAGSSRGEVSFTVREGNPGASSVFSGVSPGPARQIKVPMVRIDEVLRREDLGQMALLKVDVEGFELQVIEGATAVLDCFEVIILETRFFKYAEGMAEFHEVVARMQALGFVVYDMMDGAYRPQDRVLDLIDLVFVRKDGFLRRRIFESMPAGAVPP